jgi:NAD(P)-dependent dehydrogenase (short-subunit alcohol dehydrogenase family)
MSTVLITGANRGVGLEFARQYADAGWRVIATCRDPELARALKALEGDVRRQMLDVADDGQIAALARTLANEPIDLLINNAGIGGPHDTFGDCDAAAWLKVLRVNAIAPLHMAERFLANLERGQRKLIVNITSRMGSLADNAGGGSYMYRTSKAALNMVTRTMANDLRPRGIIVIAVSPGWVKTDMGGVNALITAGESVGEMRAKIDTLTLADSGHFFNYDGRALPW